MVRGRRQLREENAPGSEKPRRGGGGKGPAKPKTGAPRDRVYAVILFYLP